MSAILLTLVAGLLGIVAGLVVYAIKSHGTITDLRGKLDSLTGKGGVVARLEKALELAVKEKELLEEKVRQLGIKMETQRKEALDEFRAASEAFVEDSGILVRKVDGGYSEIPYCPKCHGPLAGDGRGGPLVCGCGYRAPIGTYKIGEVVKHLASVGKIERTGEQLARLPQMTIAHR